VLNNPGDMLSILLGGALGRSGRKRARRATSFLGGKGGFLTASSLMAAAGVLWGIYDSVQASNTSAIPPVPATPVPPVSGAPAPAGLLATAESLPSEILRVVRLAVSAARADGTLTAEERTIIRDRAKAAGLESIVDTELSVTRSLSDIVSGVTSPAVKRDLYILAFTIVRADESVSGAERIYLAQLAYQLGLDSETVTKLETDTSAQIDAQE
jgi:uncharacterized membrane protein YebE (DUF533 family)